MVTDKPAFHRRSMLGRSTFTTFREAITVLGRMPDTDAILLVCAITAHPLRQLGRPSASTPFSTLASMQTSLDRHAFMNRPTFGTGKVANIFIRRWFGRPDMNKPTGGSKFAIPG